MFHEMVGSDYSSCCTLARHLIGRLASVKQLTDKSTERTNWVLKIHRETQHFFSSCSFPGATTSCGKGENLYQKDFLLLSSLLTLLKKDLTSWRLSFYLFTIMQLVISTSPHWWVKVEQISCCSMCVTTGLRRVRSPRWARLHCF